MSDNVVDFKLTLNDKEFTLSVKNAGKSLKEFVTSTTTASKKISILDTTVNSLTKNIKMLTVSVSKAADGMQDLGAATELLAGPLRQVRTDISSINKSLGYFRKSLTDNVVAVNHLTKALKAAQSELSDFGDYADHAGKSAKQLTTDVKDLSSTTASANTRLNRTSKALDGWEGSSDKASKALKEVKFQLDAIISRQEALNGASKVKVNVQGGGSRGGSGSSGGGGHSESGVFSGLRGAIFTLGEVGDAARTVKEMLFGWQEPIVDAASEMQKMQVLLQGLHQDAADPIAAAGKDLSFIVDTAKSSPFAMNELTSSFVKFKSAGIDPTNGSWQALIDSVAKFGGTSETLDRAAIAIQQMSGKGVISMEELRQQLGEAVPTAMASMAKAAGVSMAELTKAISTGQVSAKEGLNYLFMGMQLDNAGAAKSMMNTFTGAVSQMETSFTLFAKKVGDSGYLDAMTRAVKRLTDAMNSADGQRFAVSLGQGLSSAIDGMMKLATWIGKNKDLLITLGELAATFAGFKLLNSGIGLLIGSGGKLSSVLVGSFGNIATAVGGVSSIVLKMISDIKNFGVFATVMFGVETAIKAAKAAWVSFMLLFETNPVGIALTAIGVAIGLLITAMHNFKTVSSEALEVIRQMPEAMNAAQRAKATQEINEKQKRYDQNARLFNASPDAQEVIYTNEEGKRERLSREEGGKRLSADKNAIDSDRKAVSDADQASSAKKARDYTDSRIDQIGKVFEKNNADAEVIRSKNQALLEEQGKSLTDEKKKAINDESRGSVVKAFQVKVDQLQGYHDEIIKNRESDSKVIAAGGDPQKVREAQGRFDNSNNALNAVTEQLKAAKEQLKNVSALNQGLSASGNAGAKTNAAVSYQTGLMQFKNGATSLTDDKGQTVKDIMGNDIVGANQLRTNYSLSKKYGTTLDTEQQKLASKALTEAMERDSQIRQKNGDIEQRHADAVSQKIQKSLQKEADGYNKALDASDQMIAVMQTGSKSTTTFAQKVDVTSKSLEKLANATPTDLISQDMIDKAKANLKVMQGISSSYLALMEKKQAKKEVEDVAPDAGSIIKAGLTTAQDRSENVADFQDKYDNSLSALEASRQAYLEKVKSDPTYQVYVNEATKRINQLIKSGNIALIKETGTATQKMAMEYGDLATQIESTWADVFSGMTDTLTTFFTTGKADFKSFAQSIVKDITTMMVKSQITLPLMNMLGMGTGESASQQSGGSQGIITALLNQGVKLRGTIDQPQTDTQTTTSPTADVQNPVSSIANPAADFSISSNVENGDGTLFGNAKSATQSMNGLSSTTETLGGGMSSLATATTSTTSGFSGLSSAVAEQSKTIASNIFSMKGLGTVSNALMATFASLSATSSSSKGKWLGFAGTLVSGVASMYAGGAFSGTASNTGNAGSAISKLGSSSASSSTGSMGLSTDFHAFAKGGIMGPNGAIPIKKYAKGGIATSPQLALFGEGSHNEAYVPLPDGRSIPVTMSGNVGGGNSVAAPVSININVQADGSSKSDTSGDTSNWKDAAEKMKSIALDTIRQEKRPGGSLNANTNGNR